MRKIILIGFLFFNKSGNSQVNITGPSSSASPYMKATAANSTVTSILTTADIINSYVMCGDPDGLGAYDLNDSAFRVLMNYELPGTTGDIRAHGSKGAFISEWTIRKSDLRVLDGRDLVTNVHLWNGTGYDVFNSSNPSAQATFDRFCAGDLAPLNAFYNAATGKGTTERIFTNGEESGDEGRVFAHVVTGPNSRHSFELPHLGKAKWEIAIARPFASDNTVVGVNDDSYPGQVYIYVGSKKNAGNEIEKAGLTGGTLYGVKVDGMTDEGPNPPATGTAFSLVNLGNVSSITGASLNSMSNNSGVTKFFRPEDGAWDPSHPEDYYFTTTNAYNSPSRLWRLHFSDINDVAKGGTIKAVLNGTEGQQMLDNLSIDPYGIILLQEDVGANSHLGKIWQYNIKTDDLKQIAQHDAARFVSGNSSFLTIDEEASGILDVQQILGPGMFLGTTMAHYPLSNPMVEGGQLYALFNPGSALLASLNEQKNTAMRISPNPAEHMIHVQLPFTYNENPVFEVSDVSGYRTYCAVKKTDEAGRFELSTNQLPAGVYILKVHAPDKVWLSKFIVLKK